MNFTIDVSGFDDFAAKVARIDALEAAEPTLRKGGLEIKKSMQADVAGRRHFRQAAPSVRYDVTRQGRDVQLWVGAQKGRGGSLAFVWLGNARFSATAPHPEVYQRREALAIKPHIVQAIRRQL